jgi:hypothetical protein
VFAQASATLPCPSVLVAAALAKSTRPWTVALDTNGGELLTRVGVTIGRLPVYKHVRMKVGALPGEIRRDRIMLPVSWEAVGGPPIFPIMEGTLHIEPEDPRRARMTLNASYDPPLGRLGELIDRAVMHRIAQVTMNDFVQRLARALTESCSTTSS